MSVYAGVHLLDAPLSIDSTFDYYIPPDLRRDILCGDFVTVPFGTANRKKIGLVVSLKEQPNKKNIEHKSVIDVCDRSFSLSPESLGLCFFLKEQTLCTVGDAAKAVVPTSAFSKMEEIYLPTGGNIPSDISAHALFVLEYIEKRGQVTQSTLKSKYGPAAALTLDELTRAGLIRRDFAVKQLPEKTEEHYSLCITPEKAKAIANGNDSVRLRSKKHSDILDYLADKNCSVERSLLLEDCCATKTQLTSLCDKGLICCEKISLDRSLPLVFQKKDCAPIVLSDEQSNAFNTICSLCDSEKPHGVLLHGVTGSGKTSVMLRTIDRVLENGKGVIVLLPEIALTPQSLEIFCSRYGDRVAVIHSGLSLGERIDTYRRIKSGDADVVIGTRSAVFAPLPSLGLIIIDEEQEHTYKSDMNPKYHARDVARYRAAYHNCVMLLASATPSFESYKKALDGKYTLIELKNRYGGARLPEAVIADMRPEVKAGNTTPLGKELCQRLISTANEGNQAILFINRRGYNNFLSCRDCGEAVLCPNCSVSMTYHTSSPSYDGGYLVCHWCGKRLPMPECCPSCHGSHLARMGYGTQKVEQELGFILPSANILRMDTDTTTQKNSYGQLLGKFRRHEADVLLGTQMVTKGHDFPDVTLVGVLLADSSLYLDDYRAAERTFAMLTQVIGRAGRAKKNGVAVIQTNNPDNECIRLAAKQDYRAFYDSEIKLRKLLVFPPFCDIALLTLTSQDEKELLKAAAMLSDKLKALLASEYSDIPIIAYGPFEAAVYKVENKYRMRMVLKCTNNKRTRSMLHELLCYFGASGAKGLSLSVDINPTNL